MKFTVAFTLVIVSMVSADIPRQKIEIVRKPAPYVASGWAPTGQQLKLPVKAVPTPAPSYGPPPAEATTTEEPTTTEANTERLLSQKAEKVQAEPVKEKSEKVEENQGGQYYVVLPQGQSVVYTVPQSAALLAVPKGNVMATARIQAVPLSSVVASSVYTPFSASYIQVFQ
ncbi:uncharacterized protein LOC103312694 [Tribolium castaneum]|uniref:DUF4794 domain-containing protein n=1 Tax=Tribolium castaneum TaxID=7070 RepID=A0A139WJB6_TRICA|nr:PREDICTED: uncharacterized protein LOC103312694 [Tribolium castaneum]KYB27996.1 hypothetical protein TcasGA2_TC032831 [Tribolium castaneum]|eukprot:XP_008192251.1 PREDICTED: uncharacterized protein LOC103312694 [Tribolium castaneum]